MFNDMYWVFENLLVFLFDKGMVKCPRMFIDSHKYQWKIADCTCSVQYQKNNKLPKFIIY